jgi:hypothetical protein
MNRSVSCSVQTQYLMLKAIELHFTTRKAAAIILKYRGAVLTYGIIPFYVEQKYVFVVYVCFHSVGARHVVST